MKKLCRKITFFYNLTLICFYAQNKEKKYMIIFKKKVYNLKLTILYIFS